MPVGSLRQVFLNMNRYGLKPSVIGNIIRKRFPAVLRKLQMLFTGQE